MVEIPTEVGAVGRSDDTSVEPASAPLGMVATLDQAPAPPPPASPFDRLRDQLGTFRLRSLSAPTWRSVWRTEQRARTRPMRTERTKAQRWRRRAVGIASTVLVVAVLAAQLNGPFGGWLADELRAVLGPQTTAQIESWYLGVQDWVHQLQYHLSGQSQSAPWSDPNATTDDAPLRQPNTMPLPAITPLIQPALAGEGVWTTAGLPPPGPGQPALVAKTFLRPDPARPYAVVTLLQLDMRYLGLHIVAGKTEPGGPLDHHGPGVIPTAAQRDGSLFAAFNGGFKFADGRYGLMTDGTVYVPPQPDAATIAITKEGKIVLGAWGHDPALSTSNTDLVAWRQNAALMIDHGQLNPLTNDGAAWGGVWLNKAYTWRSALGITDHGTLIYAAGDSLSAATLGTAMRAAGAYMAMQTDINPEWVRAFLYQQATDGNLQITKLHPGMQGTGKEYLQGTDRDFFYITRMHTAPPSRSGQKGSPPASPTPTPPGRTGSPG